MNKTPNIGLQQCQKNIPTSVKVAFMSYSRSSFDILNAYTAIHPPKKIEKNRSKQNTWFPNNDLRRQERNAFLRSVWVFTTSSAAMCWTINHDHAAESWTRAINSERMERGLEVLRQCGNADDAPADGNTRTVTTVSTTHMLITRIKYGLKKKLNKTCMSTQLNYNQACCQTNHYVFWFYWQWNRKVSPCAEPEWQHCHPLYSISGNTKRWLLWWHPVEPL